MRRRRERYLGEENKFIRRRMKRTTKQYIIVAFICILVIGGAAIFTAIMVTGQIRDKYASQLADARREMEANKRTVYVAMEDIMTGDYITGENVSLQTIYATQPVQTYITADDIGKVALVDIMTGTQLLTGMLSGNTISSELRELEYSVINISSNIANNDTVDVRISYPNGETYVVLAKKLIKGYTPESTACFFWMDEEELLRMSAAIVDAGLYAGSSLYVTKYIEPNIQEASQVTYTPSLSILSLLESDPNILARCSQELNKGVRKALENRLAKSLNINVADTAWDIDNDVFANPPDNNNTNTSTGVITVTPVPIPEQGYNTPPDAAQDSVGELGQAGQDADNYLFYSEEQEAVDNTVEFGD